MKETSNIPVEDILKKALNTDRLSFSYREVVIPAIKKWNYETISSHQALISLQEKEIKDLREELLLMRKEKEHVLSTQGILFRIGSINRPFISLYMNEWIFFVAIALIAATSMYILLSIILCLQ